MWLVYQWLLGSFQADSRNVPSTCKFFLLGSIEFCSQGALSSSSHLIYCLPFVMVCFRLISSDLALNVFFLVCVCSLCAFLSSFMLAFVGFLLSSKDAIFISWFFFPNYKWLSWNSTFGSRFGWNAPCCCFYVSSNKVFIFIIRSMCFSDISWRVSNLFLIVTVYLLLISQLVSEDQSSCVCVCVSYFYVDSVLFIHFLFINK